MELGNEKNGRMTHTVSGSLREGLMTGETYREHARVPQIELSAEADLPDGIMKSNADGDGDANQAWFRSGRFWELVVCLLFFIVAYAVDAIEITPNQRPIPYQLLENSGEYVRNLNYNETFDGEAIPGTLLIVLSFIIPFGIQASMSYFRYRWTKLHSYDMHATLCVYLLSYSLNMYVTESVKLYVGYLRPIFYDECIPDGNYQECTAENGGGNSIRKSFPSGHSSKSFCGLMLLTLYMHTRFGIVHSKKKSQCWEQCNMGASSEVKAYNTATTLARPPVTSRRNHIWEEDYMAVTTQQRPIGRRFSRVGASKATADHISSPMVPRIHISGFSERNLV